MYKVPLPTAFSPLRFPVVGNEPLPVKLTVPFGCKIKPAKDLFLAVKLKFKEVAAYAGIAGASVVSTMLADNAAAIFAFIVFLFIFFS